MRIFVARSGWLLVLTASFLLLPLACLYSEGETAADGATSAASSSTSTATTSDSGTTSNNVGIGTFSRLPFNISASLYGGYDDNPNTAPDGLPQQSSAFVSADIGVDLKLESPRTKLDLVSTWGFIYYFDLDTNQLNPDINLALTLTHKATPRLTLGITSAFVYQSEPDFQNGLGTNRRNGNYFTTSDQFSATYAWVPRFSTVTTYGITYVKYDEISSGMFEDRVENTIGNQFRFLIMPTTNLVGEYRFEVINYQHDVPVVPGGKPESRDSSTHYLLGGFDHAFSPRLTATFRGGMEFRDYDTVGEKDSPYFETTVTYALGRDTSLQWYTRYGIEEGDITFNPTRKTFRTGLTAKHNLTARISANISLYYDHDDYAEQQFKVANPTPPPPNTVVTNPSFTEDAFYVDLSLRYAVTRYLGVSAGYEHSEVSSGQAFRDYSRNRVYGGVNLAF